MHLLTGTALQSAQILQAYPQVMLSCEEGNVSKGHEKLPLPPLSLTVPPWKKVVGSLLSYSQRQLFRGEMLNLSGKNPLNPPKKHG